MGVWEEWSLHPVLPKGPSGQLSFRSLPNEIEQEWGSEVTRQSKQILPLSWKRQMRLLPWLLILAFQPSSSFPLRDRSLTHQFLHPSWPLSRQFQKDYLHQGGFSERCRSCMVGEWRVQGGENALSEAWLLCIDSKRAGQVGEREREKKKHMKKNPSATGSQHKSKPTYILSGWKEASFTQTIFNILNFIL